MIPVWGSRENRKRVFCRSRPIFSFLNLYDWPQHTKWKRVSRKLRTNFTVHWCYLRASNFIAKWFSSFPIHTMAQVAKTWQHGVRKLKTYCFVVIKLVRESTVWSSWKMQLCSENAVFDVEIENWVHVLFGPLIFSAVSFNKSKRVIGLKKL